MLNIPYGQLSLKLHVIQSLESLGSFGSIESFGSFRSFGSLGTFQSFGSFGSFRSFGHHVITSPSHHFIDFNVVTN